MVTQALIPQSIFPDLPREIPAIDKDGNFTMLWALGFAALFQALQKNFKNEGIVFPPLTQTQITAIQNLYVPFIGKPLPQNDPTTIGNGIFIPDISGQTVFDSTNRVSKQFVITYDGATPPNIVTAQWRQFVYL